MRRTSIKTLSLVALALTTACQQFAMPTQQIKQARVHTLSQQGEFVTNDSDISPIRNTFASVSQLNREAIHKNVATTTFKAVPLKGRIQAKRFRASSTPTLSGNFALYDHTGKLVPASNAKVTLYRGRSKVASVQTDVKGHWESKISKTGEYRVVFSFENDLWKINKYQWEGPTTKVEGSTDLGTYTLKKGTKNSEAGFIHEMYNRSLRLFQRENVPMDWWTRQIKTVWPGRGDYYSWGTVNLTQAHAWDVNGHEIGHAIYDQAINGRSTGGFHKIDECYNGTLALSEGFATFFSGAINLKKDDPDAHFGDNLVPRRKPIRMENVPEDVCKGNKNEWRVSAVLWDLYDTHEDKQDKFAMPLKDLWAIMSQADKPAMSNVLDTYKLVQEKMPAEAKEAVRTVFQQNYMEVK